VGLWKNIRKGWSLLCSHTRLMLGNGSRIRSGDDVWCGKVPLKEAFPVLYDIACDKDAHVADHLVVVSGSYQWDVSFFLAAHDWEVDVLASFFSFRYSTKVNCDGEDQLWWSPSHKRKFDVRSFYKALACKEAIHFPWKSIWRTKVPLKVAFFAWTAAQGKIFTLDNLRKKRVIVIDRCCMWKMNGESMDHLILHCKVARALWNAIFSHVSLSWVMHLRVVDLFACWWTGGRSWSAAMWKMVPYCLLWCLWRERNDRQFEDKERTTEELISFFFHSLYSWSAVFLAPLSFSFNDFLVLFSSSS